VNAESADPVSQQPVIEDATKMSNFSWAYEIDNEQLFEEPYGNMDQCETSQAMAAEIEFMMSPVENTTPENPKINAKKTENLQNQTKRNQCMWWRNLLTVMAVFQVPLQVLLRQTLCHGEFSRPLWLFSA
jgi:hypothetical protein